MSKIKRFENIEAWKAARGLTREIYKSTHLERFAHDYGLCNQIERAPWNKSQVAIPWGGPPFLSWQISFTP